MQSLDRITTRVAGFGGATLVGLESMHVDGWKGACVRTATPLSR